MEHSDQATRPGAGWMPWVAIGLLAACLFSVRLAALPTLLDQDQERPAAYVLDAVKNGHWICQRDLGGEITSKPPLWTWLSALATLACGRISAFTLYLPGAAAAVGTAWLVFGSGRAHFGPRAAVAATLASLLTSASFKEFGLARTDGVFAFTVAAAALLAYRAWVRGRGWAWFWLMAAAATLTKGPLGLVLAGSGMLASFWERIESGAPSSLSGLRRQLPGIVLYVGVTLGWFSLAYHQCGHALVAKMLGQELAGHVVGEGRYIPGSLIYQQPLYYLARAAPWSLLAYYGLWRVWRRPVPDAGERKFERFLFCWFVSGLLLFSLAPHQRGDLLWPLMPAGALFAGRELARLASALSNKTFFCLCAGIAVLGLGVCGLNFFILRARENIVRQTTALRDLACAIERQVGPGFPLTHVDDPTGLQVYLNTVTPPVSFARAALLLDGPDPAFVAVRDLAKLEAARSTANGPWSILLPRGTSASNCPACIVGNRPDLVQTNTLAFCFGAISIRSHGARLLTATEKVLLFDAPGSRAQVFITSEAADARKVRVCAFVAGRRDCQERLLKGGEEWSVAIGQ